MTWLCGCNASETELTGGILSEHLHVGAMIPPRASKTKQRPITKAFGISVKMRTHSSVPTAR